MYNHMDDEDDDYESSSDPARTLRERSARQPSMSSMGKRTRTSGRRAFNFSQVGSEDEDELSIDHSDTKRQRLASPLRSSRSRKSHRTRMNGSAINMVASDDESLEDELVPQTLLARSRGIQPTRGYNTRPSRTRSLRDAHDSEDIGRTSQSDGDVIMVERRSGRPSRGRGRGKPRRGGMSRKSGMFGGKYAEDSFSEEPEPTRRSGRTTKTSNSMRELLEDEEIYADEVSGVDTGPKIISIREVFQPLLANNHFRVIHNRHCDVCSGLNTTSNKGPSPLIHCQGCTTSIHKVCLGYRSNRDHLVTKVGEDNFVLQCRRCIGLARKKDKNAPDLGACQECHQPGLACAPFSIKKTSKQEEKLREENGGSDPITPVSPDLVNNSSIVLFRCINCQRGFHFEHLPPLQVSSHTPDNLEDLQEYRFSEYSPQWSCKECLEVPGKPQSIVAWRPIDLNTYVPGHTLDMLTEDSKEYLIRWQGTSYFRCTWMPGAWVWGVTAAAMRNAFARRCLEQNNGLPIMTEKDAIPEEFLRIEIVLDVKYSSKVSTHTEEVDKARIKEVTEVLVKFNGLGYDEVAWENPPDPVDTERYADFKAAYLEYIAGKYFKHRQLRIKDRLAEYRKSSFEKDLLMEAQPAAVTGGKLMEYQIEGMNWLLYNFHREKNVILADEMGLGKTIQVISALTALITEKPKVRTHERDSESC